MRIYCASQMTGKSGQDVTNYYNRITSILNGFGYEVLTPMKGKTYLNTPEILKSSGYTQYPISTDHAIIERDRWMVKTADIVFINLIAATRVSIGTVSEMAWAHDNGKHSILAMEEGNVHTHAFINEMADIRFYTEQDALAYLQDLAKLS